MSTDMHRQRGAGIVLGLALGLMPLVGYAARQERKESAFDQPFTYDATSADFDYKNKTADFKNIVVTQGATRVRADRAHAVGLDEQGFQDGRWTFEGNVRIDAQPRGTLRSDEAVVEIRNKLISTATATGKPAEFQQQRTATGLLTRGHADLIVYNVAAGTVRLTKDAWLTDGQNQITAPWMVYNIRLQRVVATSATSGRVHITIVPHSSVSRPAKSYSSSASSKPGIKPR